MKSQWAIGGLKTKGKCKLIPAFSNRTANGQSNKLCQLERLLIGLFNLPSDLIIHFHFQISSGGLFFIIVGQENLDLMTDPFPFLGSRFFLATSLIPKSLTLEPPITDGWLGFFVTAGCKMYIFLRSPVSAA